METLFDPPLPPCEFSPCQKYRYTLWRHTGNGNAKLCQFICLNPSTADDTIDDPTVRRCVNFSRRWGFGRFLMTNLFAWRDTSPAKMKAAAEPVGAANDDWLVECAKQADMTVCAWGSHGDHLERSRIVRALMGTIGAGEKMHALRITNGEPWHPLYLPAATLPFLYG